MNVVVNPGGVIGLTNGGSGKKEPIAASSSVKEGKFFGGMTSGFNVPLSIFRYKGYDSDFFTSWYNILREIFEEIKGMCPEKRVLNLALSVLMLPYIASISLGLVVYSRSKADGKIQASPEGNETKKSEVSESTAKRLAYSVLAAIAILVNIVVLVTLIIPATLALATFYLLNKKLSHFLIATVKISSGLYKNEHQNIEVSFHEIDAGESDIRWDMEIKFPPQFEQLLRDLCEDKNDKLFVIQDAEHNTILKLSANIHLKNGLKPLRNEIRGMLTTSIQGFTEAMKELLKSDKKDITKLKELLNEFRLKVVNSVDPKLTNHLIQDAYRVAFIQAIKIAQQRRREGFSLEERLKEVLVEQELRSQDKELPAEKEMIIKDLKKAGEEVPDTLKDSNLPMLRAQWKQLITEGKIAKRTVIDVCKDVYPTETKKALNNAEQEIERLGKVSREMCKKLEEAHNRGNDNLRDGALKGELEDLFKFEGSDQEVERRLIRSVIKRAKSELRQLSILDKEEPGLVRRLTQSVWGTSSQDKEGQSLMKRLEDLEKEVEVLSSEEASNKVNDFVERMYLEIKQHKVQGLLQEQKEGVLYSCKVLKRYESDLAETVETFRKQDLRHLEESALEQTLKDQNERLKAKLNDREGGHPCTESIAVLLKRNEEILKALENLESEKEGLLINEKTKNDYREELTSREKIKFAIIEDDLLEVFKQETFNEAKIKELLEKAEFEYCLAEKCIKYPVIKTTDHIKHFCQALLSPLIDNLVEKIINNVPKDNESGLSRFWNSCKVGLGYVKMGWSATKKDQSTEGKALKVAHDTYKEVETLLKYFESSYKEVGGLVGDVFSDDGETFKKDIWPQIKNHLCGMWDRFFKDVEFTLISKDKNISQEAVRNKLSQITTQQHVNVNEFLAAGA
ncbi:MAG: hypothetical protein LBH78_02970 [Rickettsiales bacterium]|jgi:hypothetical protein|nr:hypothetical protein [Rickettsiales bacterium]